MVNLWGGIMFSLIFTNVIQSANILRNTWKLLNNISSPIKRVVHGTSTGCRLPPLALALHSFFTSTHLIPQI